MLGLARSVAAARMLAAMPTGAKGFPRCLIVDDHAVVRAGVGAVLEQAFAGALITDAGSVEDVTDAADLGVPEAFDYRPDIFVMRADGSQRRRLTRHADSFAPVWSPDGQRIYFARLAVLPNG